MQEMQIEQSSNAERFLMNGINLIATKLQLNLSLLSLPS